jgi:hypothetical protein
VAGDELVQRIEGRHQVEFSKGSCDGPRQPDLREECDAAPGIAGDQCSVAQDEPPTLVARFLGNIRKLAGGLWVCERKQGQFVVAVEFGDGTRRPATEFSGARVEERGTRKTRRSHRVSPHVHRRIAAHAIQAGEDDATAWLQPMRR